MPKDVSVDEAEVRQTILVVKRLLSGKTINGFVPWRWVAKEQMGSDEYADVLSSRASMEPWNLYFVSGDKGVKLTEEGHLLASLVKPVTLKGTQLIADCVRQYAARLNNISLEVKRISRVAKVGERYVHALTVETSDEMVASETPCDFYPHTGVSSTHGRVIGQEPDGCVLYVALDCEMFESSLPASLSIDRAFLLRQLAERLRELKTMPVRMAAALQKENSLERFALADRNSLQVAAQLSGLPTPWTRFLWGPPGAGKTYGLGALVTRLQEKEPAGKTLIVAPSNRAVDVALMQLIDHIEQSNEDGLVRRRGILRFGYPRKPQILERPELLGSQELDELNRRVKNISAQIQKAESEHQSQRDIAVLRTEMLAAQEDVKNAVESHIEQCRIVATTVTLGYLASSPISKFQWDNVIVDEVTMVPPAMCAFLASMAKKRFLMAGDPQQLGPVYESRSNVSEDVFDWMGRDIFEKSGISSGEGEHRSVHIVDKRLARITAQRRCTTSIWNRVQHLYWQVDNRADESQRKHLLDLPPCAGHGVVLLDTSNASDVSRCNRQYGERGSWENPFTAALALETANLLAAEAPRPLSVAIIAPYRAQVQRLRRLLRQEQQALRSPLNRLVIDVGTVHQFQGSDADIIIFDMVDGMPRRAIGQLLRGDAGLRMVNVAFTRAKGKLILIADKKWCMKTMQTEPNQLLKQLVSDATIAHIDILPPGLEEQPSLYAGCLAETMLWNALCRKDGDMRIVLNHILRAPDGTACVCADIAFPDANLAIYLDGPRWNRLGNLWQIDGRQRHRLREMNWAFAIYSIAEIHDNVDAVADEIIAFYKSHILARNSKT